MKNSLLKTALSINHTQNSLLNQDPKGFVLGNIKRLKRANLSHLRVLSILMQLKNAPKIDALVSFLLF